MSERFGVSRSTDDGTVGTGVSSRAQGKTKRRISARAASPHSAKFRTVTAVLVGVAVAALAIAVAAFSHGRSHTGSSFKWSQWSPSDSGNQGARDIADYLAPFYRISSVNQLDVVTVVNLESSAASQAAQEAAASGTTTPTQSGELQVAVRASATSSNVSLLNGNTIAYDLCGIGGKACDIGTGQASANRTLLLRREALELALYTFKYVSGTENVVAVLPPGRTQVVTTSTLSKTPPTSDASSSSQAIDLAVLFSRQELQPLLNEPLAASLPEEVPPTVAQMASAPEAGLVEQVTARGLFSESLQQAQDGSSLIVLNPLPAQ